jgi:hypothetical protein
VHQITQRLAAGAGGRAGHGGGVGRVAKREGNAHVPFFREAQQGPDQLSQLPTHTHTELHEQTH